ncbi:hypothetical protein ACP70R_020726 [Stipagrostis hirtigluma subsp. patula]
MEGAISAVTGELVSRCISFLKSQCSRATTEQQKMDRLHHLLLRVRTVVEEADGRYITNSGMVAQLQVLADAMYRGYRVVDSLRYRTLEKNTLLEEVSEPHTFSFASSLKRCRTVTFGGRKDKAVNLELDGALDMLETATTHMAEFVVLLAGCERMLRRPYDVHLYIDNFMFGRHTEKQKLLNFLLQQNNPAGPPPVLPIIGGYAVGKKSLVAHACNDNRVSSCFSLILHLNEDDVSRLEKHERFMEGKTLIVVEFVSCMNEKVWAEFYSSLSNMKKGSKVIIVSKLRNIENFGTVKPIFLNALTYEEFSYLFKTLAFGSANPAEHPHLVRIADEFSKELQLRWSLLTANVVADAMRLNLKVQFWLWMLQSCRRAAERNISLFGKLPKILTEQGHHVDMTDFELSPAAPLYLSWSRIADPSMKKELPKVTFEELLVDPPSGKPLVDTNVTPKRGEFTIITWESRIAPYTSFVAHHIVQNIDQDMPEEAPLSGRKRQGVPI